MVSILGKALAALLIGGVVLIGCSSEDAKTAGIHPAGPDKEAVKQGDSLPSSLPPEARQQIAPHPGGDTGRQ